MAVTALDGCPEQDRLAAQWPAVRALLDTVGRACLLGARSAGRPARARGRAGRSPHPLRARQLHRVHAALVALEKLVDAAAATAISVRLSIDAPEAGRRAETADWLAALAAALDELEQSVTGLAEE